MFTYLSYIAQNSFHFDEIFQRNSNLIIVALKRHLVAILDILVLKLIFPYSRDSQDPGQQHETNLPPRLRSKDDQSASGAAPGGRTDRGQPSRKGNNKRGSGSGNQRNSSPRKNLDGHHHRGQDHHRESSSPMVSNEAARSPSPGSLGQVQRRDSALSSRNNHQRRSYR